MKRDPSTIGAWAVLAALAGGGLFVAISTGWRQSLLAAAAFAIALTCIAAIFMIWGAARSGFARLFPPQPLWKKPRTCSALVDAELFAGLKTRLDLIERHDRLALWQDRNSLQWWRSTSHDFEFTENEIFEPISGKDGWQDQD